MKSRINATVSKEGKRRLVQRSKAQDKSMSAVLDDLLNALPEDEENKAAPGKGDAWVKNNRGILKGRFTKADYQRDDLLGHILRKHAS